jgi:hypothetical protein
VAVARGVAVGLVVTVCPPLVGVVAVVYVRVTVASVAAVQLVLLGLVASLQKLLKQRMLLAQPRLSVQVLLQFSLINC